MRVALLICKRGDLFAIPLEEVKFKFKEAEYTIKEYQRSSIITFYQFIILIAHLNLMRSPFKWFLGGA
jgi:hypothetical protein